MSGHKRRSSSLENNEQPQEAGVAKRETPGRRGRPVSLVRSMAGNIDNQLAGQVFDHFCSASTLKPILRSFRYLCEILRLKPNQLPYFFPKIKANLSSWKAQALWAKLDKRASQKCYNRGKACSGTRVLIIGAGPCGLRTAIEAQLLGAKVVVIEKRDRYSRNNVLHLWPYNIHELRALGAKKFYGKFCAGSIDHISIRQLQCILLKVALLLGVEMFESVSFEDVIEPADQETGWRPRVLPADHPVSQYEFDVLIGADGKRNTLAGFKRKEFRGKLAIAITANFINKHTEAEGRVEEISGVAFIFNQKFFNDLNAALGISLENIVYYKDETHYFVMTAKKQSLLAKGVLIENLADPSALLSPDNINQEALFQYAREAADFATKGQLPHLDFAVNHYGKPDVAMFDFTSMYAADYAARVVERHGHRLLQCLVGDSLLEPFWPTGTGCPRGFFSAMDAMWLMKQLDSGKMSVLDCLAERESIHRILSQTTPSNTCKNFATCSLDPTTRYPTVNLKLVLPFQVTHLYDTDNPTHLQPQNVLQDSTPRKKKRKNSQVSPGNLLTWIQKQIEPYDIQAPDMKVCFQNGLILCAVVHRYRPDLVHWDSLDATANMENIQFAFDILEQELGLQPVITAAELQDKDGEVDRLAVISYLTGVYELFRREIPQTQTQEEGGMQNMDDLDDSVYYHNHREKREHKRTVTREDSETWSMAQLLARDNKEYKRRRRRSLETIENEYSDGGGDAERTGGGRRVSNKKRLTKLLEGARLQETKHPSLEKLKPLDIRREESFQKIQELISGVAGHKDHNTQDKKPKDLGRAIGRLDSEEWSFKQIQEREVARKGEEKRKEKVPKWSKEAFNDKLKRVKSTLENPSSAKKNHRIDASLNRLQKKLTEGSSLETGERGANKVSTLVGELASKMQDSQTPPSEKKHPELKREGSTVWQPPKNKSSRTSDNCHFCQQKVYVVERMSAEGKFFHRACFRCDYCNILLRLGSYVYHREGRFAGKFFCIPHSTENALEKYKFKTKVDEIQAHKEKGRREEKYPDPAQGANRFPATLSPIHRDRIMDLDRGGTPERAEFEASVDLSATEDDRQIMDEDEWTDLNFGTSTNLDTSDDSLSDLDTDSELQGGSERPLTADETREIAREWRARQMLERHNKQVEDVRYTDQEYEDSSDPDIPHDAVPKVRHRRRGRRVTSSTDDGTTEDTNSITETEDSSNEEIKEIERRDNNPFNTMNIPKIVVDYNSPNTARKGYPDKKYVHQAVPLSPSVSHGPTPPGTGLFNPGMTSNLYKYQFKTPDFTKNAQAQQQTAPQYRTISGILSNNLKKNWVNSSSQKEQSQKKVDPSEIDARLRSLMDRLSSQQSLLKPAEKPSAQMQHYLESTNRKPESSLAASRLRDSTISPTASLSTATSLTASGPKGYVSSQETTAVATTAEKTDSAVLAIDDDTTADKSRDTEDKSADDNSEPQTTVRKLDLKTDIVEAKNVNLNLGEKMKLSDEGAQLSLDSQAQLCSGEDSFSSLSDSSDESETSLDSEHKQEVKFDEVPEIMINLAELESLQEMNSMSSDSPAHHSTPLAPTRDKDLALVREKGHNPATDIVKLASPEDSDNDCDTSSPPNTTQTSPAKPETEKTAKKSADSNKPVPAAAKPYDSGAKTDQSADENKPVVDEKKERIPPRRRPSLLKTVVSIKGDNPEAVITNEIVDQDVEEHKKDGFDFIDDGSSGSGTASNSPDMPKNFTQGTSSNEANKESKKSSTPPSHTPIRSSSIGRHAVASRQQPPGRPSLPNQAINIYVDRSRQLRSDNKDDKLVLGDESDMLTESSTDPIKAPMVEAEKDDDNDSVISDLPPEKPPLPSADVYPRPLEIITPPIDMTSPVRETSTPPLQTSTPPPTPVAMSPPPAENIAPKDYNDSEQWDALKSTNSVEKRQKFNQFQQKQSNIVHDLIMGIPRQRRVRQPRATIPSSSIPPPPQESSDNSPAYQPVTTPNHGATDDNSEATTSLTIVNENIQRKNEQGAKFSPADRASVQDLSTPSLIAAAVAASSAKAALTPSAVKNSQTAAPLAGEEDLGSPSEEFVLTVNENNESKMTAVNNTQQVSEPVKLRERSNSRSLRDSALRLSSTISLPPTPITDPEKFGIKSGTPVNKVGITKSDSKSLMTDSCSSFDTDGLDGIVSQNPSPNHKSKSNNSSPAHKKGRGFMAAVTSIFRGSPSPITSPDSSKESPLHQKQTGQSVSKVSDQTQGSDLFSRMSRLTLKGRGTSESPIARQASLHSEHGNSQPNSLTDSKLEMKPEDEQLLLKLKNSNLPPHLMERLEKRLSTKGQMQANRAAMARVRRIQEIQRELGVVEVECADIEKEGVELEKLLAEADEQQHSKLMAEWYRLLGEKNELVRREQELMVESKQLELLDLADKEEVELVTEDEVGATQILDRLARCYQSPIFTFILIIMFICVNITSFYKMFTLFN